MTTPDSLHQSGSKGVLLDADDEIIHRIGNHLTNFGTVKHLASKLLGRGTDSLPGATTFIQALNSRNFHITPEEIAKEVIKEWCNRNPYDAYGSILLNALKDVAEIARKFKEELMGSQQAIPVDIASPPLETEHRSSSVGVRSDGQGVSQLKLSRFGEPYKMLPRNKCEEAQSRQAYIFNNTNFKDSSGLFDREGTDLVALQKMWEELGFKTNIFQDKTAEEIHTELKTVAEGDHEQHDCLVVCFLSHGYEDGIYGTDGACVPQVDIRKYFSSDQMHHSLLGKPKLFFFQACRGEKDDQGRRFTVPGANQTSGGVVADGRGKKSTIPKEVDQFFAYATTLHHKAYRQDKGKSWFFEELTEVFKRHWEEESLVDMMEHVTMRVAHRSSKCGDALHVKQCVECTTTLRQPVVFR